MENSPTITVILNAYRRPEYLREQIEAIKSQTVKPTKIWLWVNYHRDNERINFQYNDIDAVINSSVNFKYHGRLALALLAQTDYIAMFDDDTIPGKRWFENCIATEKAIGEQCILGGAGVSLNNEYYVDHRRYGWPTPSNEITEVDLVGHAWFFPRKFLTSIWAEKPISFENGEDIQLSYLAQKVYGAKTYCPPHPLDNKDLWSSLKAWEYGADKKASSNGSFMPIEDFYKQRDTIIRKAIDNGWIPLFMKNKDENIS
mgnify:CR=1 FL=1|tara:strand:- start:10071 stop:10844 length:774 start_codon:yes stop_codon:yes gene_type:complete